MPRTELKAYVAWAAVSIFWGTTYLAIRIGVEVMPPALFAGIRFLIAGVLFAGILRLRGVSFPKSGDYRHIAVVGIALLAIANGTVVWAEQWVPSSLAALIVASLPFWMVGIEAVIPTGDKLNSKKIGGILIGFAGLAVLLWPDLQGALDTAYLKGIVAMFIAPLAWGSGSIYSKYNKVKTSPLMSAAFQMLIAGAALTAVGTVNQEFDRLTLNPQGWAAIGYLVVFGSIVGFGAYIYALTNLPASFVSTYAYINPIIAVLLGWLVLDERMDWLMIAATALILTGVVLVKTSTRTQPVKSSPVRLTEASQKEYLEQES